MTGYVKNGTQAARILEVLRGRGERGVYAWEITGDLHILQYNSRIFDLRKKGFDIINERPGLFVLKEKPIEWKTPREIFGPDIIQ